MFILMSLLACTLDLTVEEFCESATAKADAMCIEQYTNQCVSDLEDETNDCRGCWLGSVAYAAPDDEGNLVCDLAYTKPCSACLFEQPAAE